MQYNDVFSYEYGTIYEQCSKIPVSIKKGAGLV